MRRTTQRSGQMPSDIAIFNGSAQRIEVAESLQGPLRKALIPQNDTTRLEHRKVGTLYGVLSGRYLKYHCDLTGKDHFMRAAYCANTEGPFISGRIVRRLGLEMQSDSNTKKAPGRTHRQSPPTISFVEIRCAAGSGTVCDMHRFYVVEECKFDILLDSRFCGTRAP